MNIKMFFKRILLYISPIYRKVNSIQEQLENIKTVLREELHDMQEQLKSMEKVLIPPPINVKSEIVDLYDFFSKDSHKAEIFMQYVYSTFVSKGDCVIDVGANHGLHTIPLSNIVGSNGKVIACEAVANNINDIKAKISANNIEFYNFAITKPDIEKVNQKISFTYFPDNDCYSGIVRRPDAKGNAEIISVPTITLDKIIFQQNANEGRNISFIKIDVECGDFDVLLGSEELLKKYKPIVIFESDRQFSANLYKYTKNDFFDYFERLGYKLFQYTGETFSIEEWDKGKIYWETWLVHTTSDYLRFFENNYINFANMFLSNNK